MLGPFAEDIVVRNLVRTAMTCFLLAACTACSAGSPSHARDPNTHFLNTLSDLEDLNFLAANAAQISVKYVANVDGREAPEPLSEACYFQNMRLYTWHLEFFRSFPELADMSFDGYQSLALRPGTRSLWAGSLQWWPEVAHPAHKAKGVISYTLYGEPGSLQVEAVVEVDKRLKACAPFAEQQLVFVPDLPDQQAFLRRERNALSARGVASLFPSELVDGIAHIAYSEGEAYGWLRVVPEGEPLEEYSPLDIVVVESAPNDISIVSGLISKNPQNPLGHVNLRLREKKTPNVAVPNVYDASDVARLENQLVHLRVTEDAMSLREASLEEAERFWAKNRPVVRLPKPDLTRSELTPLSVLRASDAKAFGAKAANLGELSVVLEGEHRPDGFGIPFARYAEFMESTGLDQAVATMLASPDLTGDLATKRARLKALRDQIRNAELPAALREELVASIESSFGPNAATTPLRFRSSTNVEDLDTLTGAGLYDSKTGCLADELDGDALGPSACLGAEKKLALEAELVRRKAELANHPERTYLLEIIADIEGDLHNEKPLFDALRKVYASLWNERAFDERAYYGIDHELAHMAVAVHPSYALEKANAVAVSNLRVDAGDPLYRVNSQVDEWSVVRPEDPTAVAEMLSFRRTGNPPKATQIKLEVHTSLLPAGQEVWPRDKLLELAGLLFRAHDHFEQNVYPSLKPLALDFEVKLEHSGAVSIKQVRPYMGTDP